MVQDAQRRRSHDTSQNLTRQQYDTHDQQETRHVAEHRHSLFGKPAQCQYISTQPKCRLRTKKDPDQKGYKRNNLFDDSIKQAFHKSYSCQT